METIKIGIIGSGFGGRVILPCLQAVPNIRVVAWASRDPGKIRNVASQYGIPRVVSSLEEMLQIKEVDLICIATPPALHRPMAEKALEAGKHVLCEKPIALNASQAQEMVQSAEKSGRLALIDHQLRFHPNIRKIKSVLEKGLLGPVRHIEVLYRTGARVSPEIPWDWWSDVQQGGGELNAIGSHFVNTLRWWFGKISAVEGILRTFTPLRQKSETREMAPVTSDEYTAFHLIFKNGPVASVVLSSVSWDQPSLQIHILGEKGALVLHDFDRLAFIGSDGHIEDLSEPDPLLSQPVIGLNPWRTSLVRLGQHFSQCLLEGRKPEGVTFEDGYRTQLVLDAIRRSYAEGRRVSLADDQ